MRVAKILPVAFALTLAACGTQSPGSAARTPTPTPSTTPRPVAAPAARPIAISAEQAALVRAHFAGSSASSGRGRGNGLPPGIARNLERGKPLPPGIAKQYLPPSLIGRLPPLSSGLEYIVVAGKLLLVEAATQIVREVLIDVMNV